MGLKNYLNQLKIRNCTRQCQSLCKILDLTTYQQELKIPHCLKGKTHTMEFILKIHGACIYLKFSMFCGVNLLTCYEPN